MLRQGRLYRSCQASRASTLPREQCLGDGPASRPLIKHTKSNCTHIRIADLGDGQRAIELPDPLRQPPLWPPLSRVTKRRLALLSNCSRRLGLSRTRARDRGLLAYTAFLGHAQLAHATPGLLPKGRAFLVHVDQVVDALVNLKD